MKKNGFAAILIISVFAILGLIGYFVYQYYFSVKSSYPYIYKITTYSNNQATNHFFKSSLTRKNEVDISNYFKDYQSISVSTSGKYITRQNKKVLDITLSKDFSFKQVFSIVNKNGEIVQTLWSPDNTSIIIYVTNENSDTGLFGEVSKTIYLVNINSMESKSLHTFEKGKDLYLDNFDSDAHKLYISESPPSTGIILPGTETFSSIDVDTGELKSEDPNKIVSSIEKKNGHKYFDDNDGVLYDLDLSQNTKRVIFNTNGGQIKRMTYLPPTNNQFIFTGWERNEKTSKYGKYTLYLYDVPTQRLSILVDDLNGTNFLYPSPDGKYVWIMPSIADDKGSYRVFDLLTKKMTAVNYPKVRDSYYDFYWISE